MTSKVILNQVLSRYDDKQKHPGYTSGVPTQVNVTINFLHVRSISQKEQLLEQVEAFVTEAWSDSRLTFQNPEAGSANVYFVEIDPELVWHPRLYVEGSSEISTPNKIAWITNEGKMEVQTRILMDIPCPMHFGQLPFDKQSCPIKFLDEYYESSAMVLNIAEGGITGLDRIKSGMWQDFQYTTSLTRDEEFPAYSVATVFLKMQRSSLPDYKNVMVPAFLFALLSYMGFWISPAAVPARAGLGVTCVLITVGLQGQVRAKLPIVSYQMWLDDFLLGVLCFNVIAVATFAMENFATRGRAEAEKYQKKSESSESDLDGQGQTPPRMSSWRHRMWIRMLLVMCELDAIMRIVYPAAFLIFTICLSEAVSSYGHN